MRIKKTYDCINCGPVECFFLARKMCNKCYKKWWLSEHPPQERSRSFHDGEVRRSERYRALHPDSRSLEHQKRYPKIRESENARIREWARKNPDKRSASGAKRRALELHACPPWADLEAIKAIYAEARRLSRETGIFHHVDHIYPLVSPYMCGLHVPVNLQILTWNENLSKGNKIQEL